MKNVFKIGGQVTGESFIGREKFVRELHKTYVEDGTCVARAYVGLTRMGKTSAIKNALYDLPKKNVIYIYEDLGECSEYEDLWRDIAGKIRTHLEMIGRIPDRYLDGFLIMESKELKWPELRQSIKGIFSYIARLNIRTVLVLDEFDNAKKLFDKRTERFELFRTIVSDAAYKVSAITISRRPLKIIEEGVDASSTFHGVFDSRPFRGFDDHDMAEYFAVIEDSCGIQLSDDQKQRIIYYAGNAPYLLSIIGKNIIDTFEVKKSIDIDDVFSSKCAQINEYYRDCLRRIENDGEKERILPFILGPNIGVRQADKDELFNIGYLREVDNHFVVISDYFTESIHGSLEMSPLWDNVIGAEKKFKSLIKRELGKVASHYEITDVPPENVVREVILKSSRIDSSHAKTYDSYIKNAFSQFGRQEDCLSVMSIADSVAIVKECWEDVFSAYFDNDPLDKWEYRFTAITRARNPVAHGHEDYLTPIDQKEIDAYCDKISEAIAKNIKHIESKPYVIAKSAPAGNKSDTDEPKENVIRKGHQKAQKMNSGTCAAAQNKEKPKEAIVIKQEASKGKGSKEKGVLEGIEPPKSIPVGDKRLNSMVNNDAVMLITSIASKGGRYAVRGSIEGYEATIPRDRTGDKPREEFESMIGKEITVHIEYILQGRFIVTPTLLSRIPERKKRKLTTTTPDGKVIWHL